MWRIAAGIVIGSIVWWLIGGTGLWLLRETWPAYASLEPELDFTLIMKLSRLTVAVACGIVAGIVIKLVVGRPSFAPWVVGAVMLVIFVPVHVAEWDTFPVWYHLSFLLTLAPLIALGARLVPRERIGATAGGQNDRTAEGFPR
jgi:hypothetical protein